MFGGFLITTSGDFSVFTEYKIGDLLVILSLAFFAYTYIPCRKLSQKINPLNSTFVTTMLGDLLLIPITLILTPISSFYLSSYGILVMMAYALFLGVIGISLWYKSLETVKLWIVSSILTIGTVAGALFAFFWLKETLNTVQIIGGTIVLISSFLISKEQK